jgi:hypothetical protein
LSGAVWLSGAVVFIGDAPRAGIALVRAGCAEGRA